MKCSFTELTEQDFNIYKSWFKDEELNRQLGPMEKETWETWQGYQQEGEPSIELGIHVDSALVGVVQIGLPEKEYPQYYILAIAVDPGQKRKGLGSQLLQQLLRLESLQQSKTWMAHVDIENKGCLLYTSPSPRDQRGSRMPSSA